MHLLSNAQHTAGEKFSVRYNKNIETYFLAEILSADYRKTNQSFEQYKIKECSVYQPIVKKAIEYFGKLNNSSIAEATARLNDTLINTFGIGNDAFMTPLLDQPEFPARYRETLYRFESNHLTPEQQALVTAMIRTYIIQLGEFFRSAHVKNFFYENESFYRGAIAEVKKHIPLHFTTALERFYKDKRPSYTALVSSMMMWPIEDNEGRGITASVETNKGIKVFEIMSPYVKVTEPTSYGYNYEWQARFLTIHEFGHSFVNKEVYKFSDRIRKSDSSFEQSKLKETMKSYGILNWEIYIVESVVRVGEIEVASLQKDYKRADALREYHIKNHFLLIPDLEKKLEAYLGKDSKYKSFGDFMPQLLTVFEGTTITYINEHL